MYDAIVVGARCGGAPTAMLLARKGYSVLLVDRSSFPSDIPHGHFIHRQGPPLLQKWGLLDRVAASNCPAVVECTMDLGDFPCETFRAGVGARLTKRRRAFSGASEDAGTGYEIGSGGGPRRDHRNTEEHRTGTCPFIYPRSGAPIAEGFRCHRGFGRTISRKRRPGQLSAPPRSISSSRLYFANRSERVIEPILI